MSEVSNARKFRATAIREDNESAIGIEEYTGTANDVEVLAIYSLYYPGKISNRDVCINIMQRISGLLGEGETATVRASNMKVKYSWRKAYEPQIDIRYEQYKKGFNDVTALANDAFKRKSSVSEVLVE